VCQEGYMRDFLQEISDNVIIADGAIGTNLLAYKSKYKTCVEHLNLTEPYKVMQLHKDYITAGARLIKTNTFAANLLNLDRYGLADYQSSIIRAGVNLARRVSGDDVFVAGTVGPLPLINGEPLSESDIQLIFTAQIEYLVEYSVDVLLFETFVNLNQLKSGIHIARGITDIPIIAQMAFEMNGKTLCGDTPEEFLSRCTKAGADVIGANCGAGVASVINAIETMSGYGVPISAFMNAGFAERIDNRRVYIAPSNYLIKNALKLASLGVKLIGGCCGTTAETIAQFKSAIETEPLSSKVNKEKKKSIPVISFEDVKENPVFEPDIPRGVIVELNPPKLFHMDKMLEKAETLKQAGAKAITLTDNPMASVRIDVITAAGFLKKTGVPIVPHLTGRDRNRISLQSSVLGAHVLGIRHLLCVTGDPIREYHETNTTGVFDLTSTGLVQMVSDLNRGRRMAGDANTEFTIGVALNPNVQSIRLQIDKLKRKIDAGAHFALTQPVFDINRFEILQNALHEGGINLPIYIGIMPITSYRIAEYLHNEVPGIQLPVEVLRTLAKYSDPADQQMAGVEIASSLIDKLVGDVHGIYITASFNRIETLLPILEHVTIE